MSTSITSYGFSTSNISNYLGLDYNDTLAVQRVIAGGRDPADLAVASRLHSTPVYDPIFGTANRWDNVLAGFEHLSQHPLGSHYHGDFASIIGDIGRGFAALFTLGATEIPIGDQRLGQVTRIEPIVSGELSGGNFVTGAVNKTEQQDIGLAFKSGTALAGVSAATAGTSYSLSGNLGDIAATPAPGPATLDPTYFGFDEETLQSAGVTPYGAEQPLTPDITDALSGNPSYQGNIIEGGALQHSATGDLVQQAEQLIVKATGKVGQALAQFLSGNIGGGINTLTGGGGGPSVNLNPGSTSLFNPSSGSGGGGGGFGYNPNSVKEGASTGALVFFGVIAGVLLLVLFLKRRG